MLMATLIGRNITRFSLSLAAASNGGWDNAGRRSLMDLFSRKGESMEESESKPMPLTNKPQTSQKTVAQASQTKSSSLQASLKKTEGLPPKATNGKKKK